METEEQLTTRYDSRKSFYNKAKVIRKDNSNKLLLKSYDTIVAEIDDGKPTLFGWYSKTTARHIAEFLKQNGFISLEVARLIADAKKKEEAEKKALKNII